MATASQAAFGGICQFSIGGIGVAPADLLGRRLGKGSEAGGGLSIAQVGE